MGLQDVFFALRLPFDPDRACELSARISEEIYLTALEASADLAERHGPHPTFDQTRAAAGQLQHDLWGVTGTQASRWAALRERVATTGLRNSLLIAVAPTATIASIAGCYECIEPQVSNLFKRETMSGEFLQVNAALVRDLKAHGRWNAQIRDAVKRAEGSVQGITELPADIRELFRTAWELPQRALIDMAAARAAFIDQSQSLNLFMAAPTIGKLSSMYLYAWKAGLKTTYYLRSRPATRIQQATVAAPVPDADAIACSLENRSSSPGRNESCLVSDPGRSWVAWSPAGACRGRAVLVPGGCRGSVRVAGFLVRVPVWGWVPGRAWVDLALTGAAASAGAVRFPGARRRARRPSPRLPVTSAAAWWPVSSGWCCRIGASQCCVPQREV
jgi:ribonucleotide reductase alpha subunit